MKILAIESSCDDTAAAVVEDGRNVLSNVVASQVPEHILYGGVVPEIASRRHVESIVGVVREAMHQSGCAYGDLDAVAATYAPGLIGALLVGVNIGGAGTLVASLASLITFREYTKHVKGQTGRFLQHQEKGTQTFFFAF